LWIRGLSEQVEGGWILNGQKRWIGNATFADVAVIFARNLQTNQINGYATFRLPGSLFVHKIFCVNHIETTSSSSHLICTCLYDDGCDHPVSSLELLTMAKNNFFLAMNIAP